MSAPVARNEDFRRDLEEIIGHVTNLGQVVNIKRVPV
jgi:hypothetical protein